MLSPDIERNDPAAPGDPRVRNGRTIPDREKE
jgi:hypothetical protein